MKSEEALFSAIDHRYLSTLNYTDEKNPRLLILFSGASGSGKTTLARKIEKRYHAVRLENDAVRQIILDLEPESTLQERSTLMENYMKRTQDDLVNTIKNHLWIIDASIDRKYKMVFNWAQQNGFRTFVISCEAPHEIRRERILKRGHSAGTSPDVHINYMQLQHKQQQEFLKLYRPDVEVRETSQDASKVWELLDELVEPKK